MQDGRGNPKDFVGANKAPLSTTSRRVMHELGLAMLEGECQYFRHNYRAAPVRSMVYIDALERHISAWVEGQDEDPDTCDKNESGEPIPGTGLSHLVKGMACLHIVRDAQLYGSLIDDRPPAQADMNWMKKLSEKALQIVSSRKHLVRGAYTEANRAEWLLMSEALASGPIRKDRITIIPPPGETVEEVKIPKQSDMPPPNDPAAYEGTDDPNSLSEGDLVEIVDIHPKSVITRDTGLVIGSKCQYVAEYQASSSTFDGWKLIELNGYGGWAVRVRKVLA